MVCNDDIYDEMITNNNNAYIYDRLEIVDGLKILNEVNIYIKWTLIGMIIMFIILMLIGLIICMYNAYYLQDKNVIITNGQQMERHIDHNCSDRVTTPSFENYGVTLNIDNNQINVVDFVDKLDLMAIVENTNTYEDDFDHYVLTEMQQIMSAPPNYEGFVD